MARLTFKIQILNYITVACICVCPAVAGEKISLKTLATYETGIFNLSAAEIVAYQKKTKHIYFINGATPAVEVLKYTNKTLLKVDSLKLEKNESPTSIAVTDQYIAVAVHDPEILSRKGFIVFFDSKHKRLTKVSAGFLPDMITFTKNEKYLIVANEGEVHPSLMSEYPKGAKNPKGSITIINMAGDLNNIKPQELFFDHFNDSKLRKSGVRISPEISFSRDVEPEYITTSPDSKWAWVALQENNALALVDIEKAKIVRIIPLGLKDHSLKGNDLDPNDKDGINIKNYPLMGLYMPDSISSYFHKGKNYILTANEGDARYEEIKVSKASIDSKALTKKQFKALKRLRISSIDGDTDGDGDIDVLHSYGARSFSIFSEKGKLIFDSGDDFAQITAKKLGKYFNSNHKKQDSGDNRSDNKGAEPEGITVGKVGNNTYAFIGLERAGGIMVYDITNPYKVNFIEYVNSHDFTKAPKESLGLGPEGLIFIPRPESFTENPLLIVAYEVSGNIEIFEIN